MSIIPWYIPAGAAAAITVVIAWGAHSLDVSRLEDNWEAAQKAAVQNQANLCESSKQPKKEADNVHETSLTHSLDTCLAKLQRPAKCVPVFISRPASGTTATCEQPTSGIESSELEAVKIKWQSERDALNAAKIWAIGYDKFVNEHK